MHSHFIQSNSSYILLCRTTKIFLEIISFYHLQFRKSTLKVEKFQLQNQYWHFYRIYLYLNYNHFLGLGPSTYIQVPGLTLGPGTNLVFLNLYKINFDKYIFIPKNLILIRICNQEKFPFLYNITSLKNHFLEPSYLV